MKATKELTLYLEKRDYEAVVRFLRSLEANGVATIASGVMLLNVGVTLQSGSNSVNVYVK